ncbi:MAG TPA: HlyD family efflux transporter periplasmic adaptor subunit [Polyangiaceae bacterium]|nr:HlyD family efflux transporter periplasmic adaptor subunit [Polyangiaceae bacterium]
MIRDTSNQDVQLSEASEHGPRRRALAAVVVLVALALSAAVAQRWARTERSVARERIRVAQVSRGTLVRDIVADGRVTAANNPTLYAVAAGTVTFHVQAGDGARRGQALAELASPELSSEVAQQRAVLAGLATEVERGVLGLTQGQANAKKLVDEAELDRQTASRELERYQLGYRERLVPELDLLRAQDNLHKAEIRLSHAQTESGLLEQALRFELRSKRLALERQRALVSELERQLDALVLRSPVEGQVGQLLAAQSAHVPANAPVLRVVDLTAFELEIAVPDGLARDLAIGMPAQIEVGARAYPGRVRSVAAEVIGGEVQSRIEFVGAAPGGLRQNQRLTARVLLDEKRDVLLIERGPSVASGSAYFVSDGVAERRPLRTGASSIGAVEILSGAALGDRIVVSGADAFGDAERVRIAGD